MEFEIALPAPVAAGSTIRLTAFYFNGRRLSGPAADPSSTRLAGGMAMAA